MTETRKGTLNGTGCPIILCTVSLNFREDMTLNEKQRREPWDSGSILIWFRLDDLFLVCFFLITRGRLLDGW